MNEWTDVGTAIPDPFSQSRESRLRNL